MARAYGQFCGLARALELVGGRWTLLIVRELLTGPKRYGELVQGLPGIASNVLASRLRELEDAGVVERALEARPSSAVVYALTPYGHELQGPVIALGLWGARTMGTPSDGDAFSCAALSLALRGTFDADAAGAQDLHAELRLGDGQRLHVLVSGGDVCFPGEPTTEPDVVLEMSPAVFAELFHGATDVDATVAAGRARVEGSGHQAGRFFEIFRLPSAGRPPDGPVTERGERRGAAP